MEIITPDDIRQRAYNARVSINRLMKEAGVQNSTFWRWDKGETAALHPVTIGKITDALARHESGIGEQAA